MAEKCNSPNLTVPLPSYIFPVQMFYYVYLTDPGVGVAAGGLAATRAGDAGAQVVAAP
jgi:hypothetical protein